MKGTLLIQNLKRIYMRYLQLKITRSSITPLNKVTIMYLLKALNLEKLTVNKNESYILMKDLDDQVIGTLHNEERKILLHLLKTIYNYK